MFSTRVTRTRVERIELYSSHIEMTYCYTSRAKYATRAKYD